MTDAHRQAFLRILHEGQQGHVELLGFGKFQIWS